MNRPLWQRARKDFIKLVDDDKIPEEHKRLNLHYLRTLPYEAISIPEPEPEPELEPEPEPEPTGWHIAKGSRMEVDRFTDRNGNIVFQTWAEYLKDFYEADMEFLFKDYSYNKEAVKSALMVGSAYLSYFNKGNYQNILTKNMLERMIAMGYLKIY